MQRRCNGIVAVLSSYEGVKYMRICESRGRFRLLAENNGQTGDLTCGAGTMALVCLGRSFQPLICCRVTKDSRMRPSDSVEDQRSRPGCLPHPSPQNENCCPRASGLVCQSRLLAEAVLSGGSSTAACAGGRASVKRSEQERRRFSNWRSWSGLNAPSFWA